MTSFSEAPAAPAKMEPSRRSFASGVAITFATRLLMVGGWVGSSIIVARWLGPAGFGTLAVLNATVALTLQIASAGLPSANTYFVSRNQSSLGPVWGNAILFGLLAGSFSAVVVLVLGRFSPSWFGEATPKLLALAVISIPFQML